MRAGPGVKTVTERPFVKDLGDGDAQPRNGVTCRLHGYRRRLCNGACPDRLLAQPDTQKRFADLGMTSEGSAPEALDAYIRSEIAKWSKVIRDANIRAE